MPEAPVYDAKGVSTSTLSLSDLVFGETPNRALLHQAVLRQQANARQGTHDTKTRGEVAGSTRKMWRQKGTGRARQGAKRAPHWRGGGVVFGPHPRSYVQAMPKKMRAGAIRSALSAKAAAGQLVVIQEFGLDQPKTKALAQLLDTMGAARTTLVILDQPQRAVQLSARNLPDVRAITTEAINVVDLLKYQRLIFTAAAVRILETRYGGEPVPAAGVSGEAESAAEASAPVAPVSSDSTEAVAEGQE